MKYKYLDHYSREDTRIEVNGYVLIINNGYNMEPNLFQWIDANNIDVTDLSFDEIYSHAIVQFDENHAFLSPLTADRGNGYLHDCDYELVAPIIERWIDEHLKLPYYLKGEENQITQLFWKHGRTLTEEEKARIAEVLE